MKTEPTALAAGPEAPVNEYVRPEASAYGSQKNAFRQPSRQSGPTVRLSNRHIQLVAPILPAMAITSEYEGVSARGGCQLSLFRDETGLIPKYAQSHWHTLRKE